MGKNVIVLGSGLIGSAIAIDLSKQFEVTVADKSSEALSRLDRCFGIKTVKIDVTERKKLENLIAPFNIIIGAMPADISYDIIKRVIECNKNMVDISFFPGSITELANRAKYKKVTLVIDCGIAPGLSNMIAGFHTINMKVEKFECFIGGLPVERRWPWQYKAIYHPHDVIKEFLTPARFIENGKQIAKEAFTDPEFIHIDGIGTLEAWNSDGLRTMLKTLKIPNMIEKTLRYPKTVEYLKVLYESGFFSEKEVDINGTKISPINFTTKILSPVWELKKNDEDITIMRTKIFGYEADEPIGYQYNITDRFDHTSGISSMARTTGYTCAAVAQLIQNGTIKNQGLVTPEQLAAEPGIFKQVLQYLDNRNVKIEINKLY